MAGSSVDEFLHSLQKAEQDWRDAIERKLKEDQERFRYTVEAGKVRFEEGVNALHRRTRKSVLRYLFDAPLSFILSAPLVYGVLVPIALLDLALSVYQHVCFRIYGIDRVKRSDYLVFDRVLLGYLNPVEKLNCAYCTYANGVIAYSREIAARTEQYWCPIKHAGSMEEMHARMRKFFEYGDAEGYRAELPEMRARLKS